MSTGLMRKSTESISTLLAHHGPQELFWVVVTWWEELGWKWEGSGFAPDAVTSSLYHLA